MKKKYISPVSCAFQIETTQMLAVSGTGITISDSESTIDGGSAFSQGRGGWSSENWTDNQE